MDKFSDAVVDCLPLWLRIILRECLFVFYRKFGRPHKALESTKARGRRLREGFFALYCGGRGIDIGYGGDLLTPGCKGWDREHGDAQFLHGVPDSSFDFIYSSHTLEDMIDSVITLQNWWRVLKPNGYLILYVPQRDLYEKKKALPSRWNTNHKHFFLLDRDEEPDTRSLLGLIKNAIPDHELVYAKDCSEGHTITDPDLPSDGEYSIEVVLRKLGRR